VIVARYDTASRASRSFVRCWLMVATPTPASSLSSTD